MGFPFSYRGCVVTVIIADDVDSFLSEDESVVTKMSSMLFYDTL